MDSTPLKKFRTIASAGKVMASVFLCDKNGIIHVDFLPRGVNIIKYYCKVLQDVHNALKKKRPGAITKGCLLYTSRCV